MAMMFQGVVLQATRPWELAVGVFFMDFCLSPHWLACMVLTGNWFDGDSEKEYRDSAVLVISSSFHFGVLFGLVVYSILLKWLSWRALGFLAIGFSGLAGLTCIYLLSDSPTQKIVVGEPVTLQKMIDAYTYVFSTRSYWIFQIGHIANTAYLGLGLIWCVVFADLTRWSEEASAVGSLVAPFGYFF